ARVLGHRQTKAAATDNPHLMSPRHIPTLPQAAGWAWHPGQVSLRDGIELRKITNRCGARRMKTVDSTFFGIGVLWLLIGMILAIVMGASHNFQFMPLHAHI